MRPSARLRPQCDARNREAAVYTPARAFATLRGVGRFCAVLGTSTTTWAGLAAAGTNMDRRSMFSFPLLPLVLALAAQHMRAGHCSLARDGVAHGAAAAAALGARLAQVSSFYGFPSGSSLRELLLADPDLGVDEANDLLLYACSSGEAYTDPGAHPRPPHAAAAAAAGQGGRRLAQQLQQPGERQHTHQHTHTQRRRLAQDYAAHLPDPTPATAPLAPSGLPLLHSRCSATRKLLLDFDGCNTTDTYWNSLAGAAQILTPPYRSRGSSAAAGGGFGADEQEDVIAIWRAVSEDFAPFDLDVSSRRGVAGLGWLPGWLACCWARAARDPQPQEGVCRVLPQVTTEDPGPEGLVMSGDDAFGLRVCIGGSSWDWWAAVQAGLRVG